MNKIILIGNISKDPDLSYTANGIAICKFSIAVNRRFTTADGEREVDFFNIVTWRGLAENCGKYLAKGKKAAISGSLQTRSYEDKEGVKRYVTEITADDVEFLSPKSDGGDRDYADSDNNPKKQEKRVHPELKPVESDDLPF